MTNEKRITALEAEAAFEAAAQMMGGWDELSRWARTHPTHCKEILSRFLPEGFFKQGPSDITLGELLSHSRSYEDASHEGCQP
jgi:hypothetical protein